MMKKLKLIIFGFVLFGMESRAQDFHLSIYDAGPLFLNPAMTGVVDSKARIHAQYRNQWSSVAFKPFTTALISADVPYGKWGFGVQIINMNAGIGSYNVFQGLLSAAYSISIDKNKYHNISFGLQAGITQKAIVSDLYSFDNQYSNKDGGYFDKTLSTDEKYTAQAQILPQVNAGILYFYSKQQSRINPFLGISAFNLTHARETFFDQNNYLPVRVQGHLGVRVNITEMLYLLPKVLIMGQGTAFEQAYALDAGYYLKPGKLFLLAGYVLRAHDASIASIGVKKEEYILKFGYDFNTSTLQTATKTQGAMEISFTYMFGKEKVKKLRHCPRL